MKLRILVAVTLTGVVALGSTTASAKGAMELTISGPALAAPIRLTNDTSGVANEIAEKAGLFKYPADRVLTGRPSGNLGPRYAAAYGWLIAQGRTAPLRQELYPFADGGAVAYTPRQRVGDGRPFRGWYRAGAELTMLLVAAGVPVPPSYVVPVPVVAPAPLTG